MILGKLTGWGLDEMLDLTLGDLEQWLKSAQEVEKEINKQIRKK